jgi:murein DD-endopeptidase MepM/ murein hydrolase activator NlpD
MFKKVVVIVIVVAFVLFGGSIVLMGNSKEQVPRAGLALELPGIGGQNGTQSQNGTQNASGVAAASQTIMAATDLAVQNVAAGGATNISAPSLQDLQNEQNDNDKRMRELEEQTQDLSKKLRNKYIQLERTKGDLKVANTKYQIALDDYHTQKQNYDNVTAQLTAAKQQLGAAEQSIKDNRQKMQSSKLAMGRLARQEMLNMSMGSTLPLLMGSKDAAQISENYLVSTTINRLRQETVNNYRETSGMEQNSKIRLTQVTDVISGLEQKAEAAYTAATAAEQTAQETKQELATLEGKQQQQAAGMETQKAAYKKEMRAREAEQKTLNAQIEKLAAAARAAGGNLPYTPGFFGPPLATITVSQPWGWRIHPIWGYRSFHTGVDLSASCGTPIYATAAGTVQSVITSSIWGKRTTISHGVVGGNSIISTYNHQSAVSVSAGQKVSKGQRIGSVGTTGWSTGCHLHFEIYSNGKTVNPMNYI